MITVYDAKETNFNHNGLAILAPISCTVSEELNGSYELELVHPIDEAGKWENLEVFSVIRAPTPRHGYQLFRIYQPGKVLGSGVEIKARHVFYDLLYNYIESCILQSKAPAEALWQLLGAANYKTRFTAVSDITDMQDVEYEGLNLVEAIMEEETGLLALYGGELDRDNFYIGVMSALGVDNGVSIRYGKNLTGLDFTENVENTATRIIPYYKNRDVKCYLPEYSIDSGRIDDYPFPLVTAQEFSDLDEEPDKHAVMRERVQAMYDEGADLPEINVKVKFVNLEKTEEYKDYKVLETVNLGDIVSVHHPRLDIDLQAKCISYVYDCLLERYEEIELGRAKSNLAETTVSIERSVSGVTGGASPDVQGIRNALGGYVLKRNGELLVMDTGDVNTAKRIWKWDKNGLSYSSTGYIGTWVNKLDMNGNGL